MGVTKAAEGGPKHENWRHLILGMASRILSRFEINRRI